MAKTTRVPHKAEAKKRVRLALSKLAHIRDLLSRWQEGDGLGMDEVDCAWFLRVALVAAGSDLERGLVELGTVEKDADIFVGAAADA